MTVVDAPATLPALAAGHLRAAAARHAEEAERTGRLHPEVVEAMTAAGLARHFVPRRWGGRAGRFAELLDTVADAGTACASAAWCAVLLAAHARLAAHLPEEGRRDLWGDSPDVRIAAAIVPPAGRLARVPGGWTLSGEWAFASGVEHADWVLLASLDHSGDGAPAYRVLAVPREQVGIRETWDAVGLRATGSHSVTVDGVFVPEHRTFLREALAGVADADAAPCHRVPYQLVAALLFAAPALGAARGALEAWTLLVGGRRLPDGRPLTDDPTVQQTLARCAAEIEAARLLLETAAARADGAAEGPAAARADGPAAGLSAAGADGVTAGLSAARADGATASPAAARADRSASGPAVAVALNQRDAALAVDLLTGAVERLMRTGGARGLVAGGGLERAWRDIHAIAAHAALQPAPAAAAYAATVFPPGV
ncbi:MULTISPECIES: acyl-CoA dehydrogenase family protein [Streptomyces]|uniref:Alkylation response protein AidB-like acyl-CoA dehydrogenase n=1 Tax=Streptomyces nymphaeiformis TaxID=2663842 RepID=A0A7W7XG67_9ACTN|nr:acyl-CoA dehydrogenase family protein [Streptomyces nymphaeiformis]MBB4986161.1 alkylation response protein AidB-like acyl-CoA dehydrogenase [Streptomyces nymphaeiformis]